MSAFVPILALDRVAALPGVHSAAPVVGRRIQSQSLGLAHIDREQPPRNAAPHASGTFTEAMQPVVRSLTDRAGKILEVAVGIAALKLLETLNSFSPHALSIPRGSTALGIQCPFFRWLESTAVDVGYFPFRF